MELTLYEERQRFMALALEYARQWSRDLRNKTGEVERLYAARSAMMESYQRIVKLERYQDEAK